MRSRCAELGSGGPKQLHREEAKWEEREKKLLRQLEYKFQIKDSGLKKAKDKSCVQFMVSGDDLYLTTWVTTSPLLTIP